MVCWPAEEVLEDTIYNSQAMTLFVEINLSREGVPNSTTLLKFRHLLERHDLTRRILVDLNTVPGDQMCLMKENLIVDVTLFAAPVSTKNRDRQRDAEMHQSRSATG